MLLRTLKRSTRILAAAAATILLSATLAHSEGASKPNVFTKFGGNWTGNGLIYLSNGRPPEKIRCKGGFTPKDAFNVISLRMELRCAGDSYNFELQSELNYSSGQITGIWTEITRGLNGKVTGSIKDDQITAVAEGQTFTANLDLINLGDKQQVRITSPGSEMSDVLIGLIRLK